MASDRTLRAALAGGMALLLPSVAAMLPGTAHATLHAFCYGSSSCTDNGTVTPVLQNPPQFGFSQSPSGTTSNLLLEVLIPDNVAGADSESFSITGTQTGHSSATSSLVSSTAWTSGKLGSYLGFSGSPANPIGAFLPTTQTYQPTAGGYYVYQLAFGSVDFASADPEFSTSFDFPTGSIVTAFAFQNRTCKEDKCTNNYDATANSGALAIEGDARVAEPATLAVLGSGLLGIGLIRRRRS